MEKMDKSVIENHYKELEENYSRFFALEDDFESLYDVELESGHYVSFDRDEFYKRNVSDMVVSSTEFFDDLKTNVEKVVFEDDREETYNFQTREAIISGLAEKDHLDHYYRIMTENGLMWLRMRIVYKDDQKTNVIVGIFNADEEMARREELEQTNARLFALEDNFESLYDVEIESGHYDVYVKGDFFRDNILGKLAVPKDYFEELHDNIDAVIYEADREGLYNTLTRESIAQELRDNDHFDYYYRLNTDDGPVWFKMRIVYKDVSHKSIIIGVFNAADEMRIKEKEEQLLKETELKLRHEQLRSEILEFMINYNDDPIELLSQFAEKLRVLINCDQVIYRDLEETRIMVNSDGIADTWAVPLEYCKQCQHFDAHHPMYKDGYTEMDNCQEGWQGIPVYHECPIKSSLTRIVYCDGEVAGYLAIHYVQNHHRFNDLERETVEIFSHIMSLSLSRYTARVQAGELTGVKRSLNMMFSLSDEFDPIIVFDPETGEYDWFQSRAQEVQELTSMSIHGKDLYQSIGIDGATIIHEDDREQYKAFYTKENMMKLARTGETQETENRWRVGPDNTYLWKYNKAVRMIDENGKVYIVVGVIDTTEKRNKEAQIRETYKKLEEANHRNVLLHKAVKASVWSYDINEKDEVVSAHYDDYAKDKTDVGEIDSPMEWVTNLHPDDKDRVLGEFMAAIRDHSGNTLYETTYRLMTFSGNFCWIKTSGRLVRHDDGTAQLIGISVDMTEEIEKERRQKAEIEEALVFTNFFLDTYISAYYVNFETLSCRVYKRTGELEKNYPIVTNYIDSITDYINKDVHPEDREELLKEVQPARMKEILKEKKEYTRVFRDISGGVEKYYRIQIIRGSEENHAAFGFSDITEDVKVQQIRKSEEEEAKKLIDSIAALYNAAYAVNLKTDEFKVIRMDDTIIGSNQKFNSFSEAKKFFLNLIPESDRDAIRYELEYDTIRKKLETTKTYDVEYRLMVNNAMIWHIMNVTLIDNDYVALGFANRDLEITQKHLEDKRYSEYFALYEIDIDSGMMKIVKDSPYYGIDRAGTAMPFKPVMLKFAQGLDEEPRTFFERMADLDYVKQQYATEDKSTYAYRSNNVGEKNWVDCTSYVTLRHSDGTPAMFTFGFSLLDSLGVYRQELQNKYVEQNAVLVLQQEELEQARGAADAANEAKSNFLFSMSHDIRTPMNAIKGFTTMAKKHVSDEKKVVEYLDKIDISGQQLLTLINQVLEMARIEAGKVEFEENPINVQDEFNAMVTVLEEQAHTKGLAFRHGISDVKHNNILADEAKMSSITLNIVGNAMKYTPEGGSVDFLLKEIEGRKPGYATYVFTVSDTGIGMNKEFLDKLYEPFAREQSSTVSKIQGTGLGMSIVKSTIDLMGGNIDVWSESGKGTRFDITLDFKIDETGAQMEEDANLSISFEGRRVLLVEDNEMNREIAKDILEEQGLIIEDAEDGDIAVDMVKAAVDRGECDYYDFILMDVQMPRLNGYEATKAIRSVQESTGIHTPIIAMTANAFEEDRQNALASGMDEHLAKPIDIQKMFKVIARFL